MFEGGIRVPGIVAWPGVTKPGSTCDTPIQTSDLYPTILSQLSLDTPQGHIVDGTDVSPLLAGESIPDRPIFTYFPHNPPVPDWLPPSVSVHRGQWKLIRLFHQGEDGKHDYRLYNVDEDIGETNDLSNDHPELVSEMDQLIERHLRDARTVVPQRNPKFDAKAYKPERIGVGRIRN